MGLVIVTHRHARKLGADLDHGVVEDGRKGFIVIEPLDCFFDEVEAYSIVVNRTSQKIRSNGVMLGIWFAAKEEKASAMTNTRRKKKGRFQNFKLQLTHIAPAS